MDMCRDGDLICDCDDLCQVIQHHHGQYDLVQLVT